MMAPMVDSSMKLARSVGRGWHTGRASHPDFQPDGAMPVSSSAVAYGMPFLAYPDLPQRFRSGATLNLPNPDTIYAQGAAGYTDYPFLEVTT